MQWDLKMDQDMEVDMDMDLAMVIQGKVQSLMEWVVITWSKSSVSSLQWTQSQCAMIMIWEWEVVDMDLVMEVDLVMEMDLVMKMDLVMEMDLAMDMQMNN